MDFPFPVNNGGRLRTLNFLRALQDTAEITFLYLAHKPDPALVWDEKNFRCKVRILCVPQKLDVRKSFSERIRHLLRFVPWELQDHRAEEFSMELSRLIEEGGYDCVFVRYIKQAHFLLNILRTKKHFRLVIDLDDIEPIKLERALKYKVFSGWYEKYRVELNSFIFQIYHRIYLGYADRCIVCSRQDKEYVSKKNWARRIEIIPNALEFEKYAAVGDSPHNKTILFCGTLHYEPNVEGLVWFFQKVWPLLKERDPAVTLLIVGRKPCDRVQAMHDGKTVFVYPDVPDVLPFYQRSSLSIAPLWIAGGTRVKIIEAAACRRPVLATTIGAEGLDLKNGEHLLLADTPETFAEACLGLLNDRALAERIALNGYHRCREIYDLPPVLAEIRKAFELTEPVHSGSVLRP